jgi:hypothetical protein
VLEIKGFLQLDEERRGEMDGKAERWKILCCIMHTEHFHFERSKQEEGKTILSAFKQFTPPWKLECK